MTTIRNLIRTYWLAIVTLLFVAFNFVGFSQAVAQDPAPTTVPIVSGTINAAEATTDIVLNFFNRLTQTPDSTVMRVVMLVVGMVLLVVGWRVYEFVIVIAGAMVGAAIASSLVVSPDAAVNLMVLLIGGVIGAVLSFFLYYVAVFLIGMHFGILLTNGLATTLTLQPVSPLALLIGGVIGGVILLGLSFQFLIVLSSLVGAQLLVVALGLPTIWIFVIALIGILLQFGLTRAYHYDFRRSRRTVYRRRTSEI
ncbi:MAG: DUF4203 domain-containing protein [Anaerolineaceae bacterium]|nr:DUF4203 domain-containing protein [Anaerolineaceae bacterium]